jgi:uncharacterized protein (DUF2336 family)
MTAGPKGRRGYPSVYGASLMVDHNLLQLQDLARDKTPAGRRTLTTTIGDLFCRHSDRMSEPERALMGGILLQLIGEVEVSVRQALAQRLAGVPAAPHDVVVALANDIVEVARPLLQESPVLNDPDLIQIIRQRSEDHQFAIALRKDVSESVSDALVATERQGVIAHLLGNPNAKISAKTIDYLVEQSERVDAYHNPLLTRAELTPELAGRMYGWVSSVLKAHILAHYAIDPLTLAQATATVVQELSDQHLGTAKTTEDELAERLDADKSLLPPLIVQALRDGEVPLFLALFARFTGLSRTMARDLLYESRGEALCITCKASGIDRSTFASIYLLSRKARYHQKNVPLSDMAGILAMYDRLSPIAAASLLDKWRQQSETTQPAAGSA